MRLENSIILLLSCLTRKQLCDFSIYSSDLALPWLLRQKNTQPLRSHINTESSDFSTSFPSFVDLLAWFMSQPEWKQSNFGYPDLQDTGTSLNRAPIFWFIQIEVLVSQCLGLRNLVLLSKKTSAHIKEN